MTQRREFSLYVGAPPTPSRWSGPVFAALVLYSFFAAGLILMPVRFVPAPVQQQLEVKFVQEIPRPEPSVDAPEIPAQPAPLPVPKAQIPLAAAAPVVPPHLKGRKLEKAPPLKKLQAPRTVPAEIPKEAEPTEDKGVAILGEPEVGDPAGLEGGAEHGAAGGVVGGVVDLPGDATPPKLLSRHLVPEYPAAARALGKTGVVVLKVIVYANGSVGDVQVVEGEEQFVAAALKAVTQWHYEPARYKGQPIAVYRQIRIPFELTR